ncbi:hypothetical protein L228DRAFT_248908 [Xylona heveae TC161]|uniref:VHS domain-containing protein n=1 Tax=Xylona heveae (strain CBS 132557 / TC161) TaxID=1328760 RepID=A0A165FM18_XYLHT|nr:hypothetical protein L228DRAFT_248908 [Xylona heveae TC161]KZF21139.1 hypothetical protein L228DRAFT_248908 [Xylona heveae TC161]
MTDAKRLYRKYGNVHRQLRALTILDGLIQNAGPRFQRTFLDEPLLERLRIAATDSLSDVDVKKKCKVLFGQWAVAYKDTPGLERLTALYRQLPQRKRPQAQQPSKVLRETEEEAENDNRSASATSGRAASRSISSPTQPTPSASSSSSNKPITLSSGPNFTFSSSSKDKKGKVKPFNLEKEKPQLLQTLASSSVASTNLMNALRLVNRENKRVSEDPEVMRRFETCKLLRRQILRYIQNVESEQWLGGLIHANEELVNALQTFEVLDKSTEVDSDSDSDEWDSSHTPSGATAARTSPPLPPPQGSGTSSAADALAGLNLDNPRADVPPAKPPRPTSISMPPLMPAAASIASQATFTSHANGKGRVSGHEHEPEPRSEDEDEDKYGDDDDDPFADRNAIHTPGVERTGMAWR